MIRSAKSNPDCADAADRLKDMYTLIDAGQPVAIDDVIFTDTYIEVEINLPSTTQRVLMIQPLLFRLQETSDELNAHIESLQ